MKPGSKDIGWKGIGAGAYVMMDGWWSAGTQVTGLNVLSGYGLSTSMALDQKNKWRNEEKSARHLS